MPVRSPSAVHGPTYDRPPVQPAAGSPPPASLHHMPGDQRTLCGTSDPLIHEVFKDGLGTKEDIEYAVKFVHGTYVANIARSSGNTRAGELAFVTSILACKLAIGHVPVELHAQYAEILNAYLRDKRAPADSYIIFPTLARALSYGKIHPDSACAVASSVTDAIVAAGDRALPRNQPVLHAVIASPLNDAYHDSVFPAQFYRRLVALTRAANVTPNVKKAMLLALGRALTQAFSDPLRTPRIPAPVTAEAQAVLAAAASPRTNEHAPELELHAALLDEVLFAGHPAIKSFTTARNAVRSGNLSYAEQVTLHTHLFDALHTDEAFREKFLPGVSVGLLSELKGQLEYLDRLATWSERSGVRTVDGQRERIPKGDLIAEYFETVTAQGAAKDAQIKRDLAAVAALLPSTLADAHARRSQCRALISAINDSVTDRCFPFPVGDATEGSVWERWSVE